MTSNSIVDVYYGDPSEFAFCIGSGWTEPARNQAEKERRAARCVLNHLLARREGVEPESIRFAYGSNGKPELDRAATKRRMYFNLSHTSGRFSIAISDSIEVGIDVECIRPSRDHASMAEYAFSQSEIEALRSTPSPEQPLMFTAIWARKEAIIKAVGGSAAQLLDMFSVSDNTKRCRSGAITGGPQRDPVDEPQERRVLPPAGLPSGPTLASSVATSVRFPLRDLPEKRPDDPAYDRLRFAHSQDLPAGPLYRSAVAFVAKPDDVRVRYSRVRPSDLQGDIEKPPFQ